MRSITQLTGFQTTDGKTFPSIQEARQHQAQLDITEMYDRADIHPDVREWLDTVWDELEDLMWVRACGGDLLYRHED